MDKIHKHCKKITDSKVAKVNLPSPSARSILTMQSTSPKQEESSRLADLCSDLIKRLGDGSLTLQQSNYENIKKHAVCSPSSFYTPLT